MSQRRSLEVPLLILGAAVFIGYPLLRDVGSEPMLRKRYTDPRSCQCDYPRGCTYENGAWAGPWYARWARDRRPDDPGAGVCHRREARGRIGAAGSADDYRQPTIETGHRGGFGGTGAVRSSGS